MNECEECCKDYDEYEEGNEQLCGDCLDNMLEDLSDDVEDEEIDF